MLGCEMGSMFGMGWWMWFPGVQILLPLKGVATWPRARSGGPVRILEERYARGEIDAEEFERRRATLEGSR